MRPALEASRLSTGGASWTWSRSSPPSVRPCRPHRPHRGSAVRVAPYPHEPTVRGARHARQNVVRRVPLGSRVLGGRTALPGLEQFATVLRVTVSDFVGCLAAEASSTWWSTSTPTTSTEQGTAGAGPSHRGRRAPSSSACADTTASTAGTASVANQSRDSCVRPLPGSAPRPTSTSRGNSRPRCVGQSRRPSSPSWCCKASRPRPAGCVTPTPHRHASCTSCSTPTSCPRGASRQRSTVHRCSLSRALSDRGRHESTAPRRASTGERSSRRIERRWIENVPLRVVAANQQPERITLVRFRAVQRLHHVGPMRASDGQWR